jgi:ParB-like chromosome segregation protein Spo0J
MFLRGSVMSYELIYKKVNDLLPYINNARTHSEEQINQIAASIREFGFTNPLLIDGVGTIIAGHGRLHGAKKSGLEEVPCIVLDHLTKAQQKALIIADNQLALNAGWDMDLLSVEMKDLDSEGFDLSLIGFDDGMLMNLSLLTEEGLTDAEKEWEGMPEFDQGDNTSFRHVIVHFENNDDVKEFFSIIGQSHTDKTKSIWFPEQERMDTESKRYG